MLRHRARRRARDRDGARRHRRPGRLAATMATTLARTFPVTGTARPAPNDASADAGHRRPHDADRRTGGLAGDAHVRRSRHAAPHARRRSAASRKRGAPAPTSCSTMPLGGRACSTTTRASDRGIGWCRSSIDGCAVCGSREPGRPTEALVAAVLEQKVTGLEARRAYRRLALAVGEPAPGPVELVTPPDPAAVAAMPSFRMHPSRLSDRGPIEAKSASRPCTSPAT